jgi:uncharacterized membrane protein
MAKKSDSKMLATLAYAGYVLGPVGLVVALLLYLMKTDDAFVRFHALQSVLLGLAVSVIGVVLVITVIGPVIWGLAAFVAWVFVMYKAYSGEKYKLPLLGDWAEKYSA